MPHTQGRGGQLRHPPPICMLISKGAVEGMQLIDSRTLLLCDSCEYAKSTRKLINKECEAPLTDAFGAEIHTDL